MEASGTNHPEVVENTEMGTLKCSNVNSSVALLYYLYSNVSDDYMSSVKCLGTDVYCCLLLVKIMPIKLTLYSLLFKCFYVNRK